MAADPTAAEHALRTSLQQLGQVANYELAVVYELQAGWLSVRATDGALADTPIRHHTFDLARVPTLGALLAPEHGRPPASIDGASYAVDPFEGALDLPEGHPRLSIALCAGEHTVGLLTLDRRGATPFSDAETDAAMLYAQVMALSLSLAARTRALARVGRPSDPPAAEPADAHGFIQPSTQPSEQTSMQPSMQTSMQPSADVDRSAGFPTFRKHEHDFLLQALERTHGKIHGPDGAAALLGLRPTTLQSKLKRHGIKAADLRKRAS